MDLYAIHKLYQTAGQDNNGYGSSSTSEKSLWDSHYQDREEFARFLNMMLAKTPLLEGSNIRPYDPNFDDSSESTSPDSPVRNRKGSSSSADFVNPGLFSPYGGMRTGVSNASGSGSNVHTFSSGTPRVTLADQFTWGAVVCAGVFIVVFVCVMAAWWVHKKQQGQARRRIAQMESRRNASSSGPYCIESDVRLTAGTGDIPQIQRPPSYFEVIGFFDPPPSYSDVLRVGRRGSSIEPAPTHNQAYDNVAVTIDELPPPFVEGDYVMKPDKAVPGQDGEPSAILTTSTAGASSPESGAVTVIPDSHHVNREGSSHC